MKKASKIGTIATHDFPDVLAALKKLAEQS